MSSTQRRLACGQGEALEGAGPLAVAGPRAAAPPGIRRRDGRGLLGVGRGVGLDLYHRGDLAVVQALAELAGVAVAGVGRPAPAARKPQTAELIQHVQRQLPLGPMAHKPGTRQAARRSA